MRVIAPTVPVADEPGWKSAVQFKGALFSALNNSKEAFVTLTGNHSSTAPELLEEELLLVEDEVPPEVVELLEEELLLDEEEEVELLTLIV